ncbi:MULTISPECIES: hypothetical protein [unclassified Coleofasciculus]|uniref:hypothetical protein n=1 Tax=unclassified Coleofasciculus TaxID=2692782 RepID=UPI0018805967|nr:MULTISPECIES: hypothetical protein [unclassified Coleofasciculus]MBE9125466.1 hypothetical protein [Coleofasciculus sp. LEGE 07081]MBE9147437.1 hypothetical protein [Coleofasciculus sp. LEGE 07092]
MSSTSKSPYRSRLFNFLNRESRRWIEQSDRALRHLKVAAIWGVQVLLYPVYLLVQGTLSVGRQLSSAARSGFPKLKTFTQSQPQKAPPAADTPIQRVLKDVEILPLPDALDLVTSPSGFVTVFMGESSLEKAAVEEKDIANRGQPTNRTRKQTSSQHRLIQGVATLLTTRSLVLVTAENEILDILTPQQQEKLSSKISWEVANLFRQWRLNQKSELKKTQRCLSHLDKPPLFLPLRLFWRVIAWVQISPVAIAVNLFGESTLVEEGGQRSRGAGKQRRREYAIGQNQLGGRLEPRGALTFLDRTIAQLESHTLITDSEMAITLRDRTQKLFHNLRTPFITPRHADTPTEASETHRFWLQALIYAAIDYFFGRHKSDLSQTDYPEQAAVSANPTKLVNYRFANSATSISPATLPESELTDISKLDPWLTWNDVFGTSETGISSTPTFAEEQPTSPPQLLEGFNRKIPLVPEEKSIWGKLKRYLSIKLSPGKLAVPPRQEPKVKSVPSNLFKLSCSVSEMKGDRKKAVPLAQPSPKIYHKGNLKAQQPTSTPLSPTTPNSRSTLPTTTRQKKEKSSRDAINSLWNGEAQKKFIPHSPNIDIEPAPDWIETKATPTGYVKHPLEQVLGWLDIGMLWLEELVIRIWRWVRKLRRHR